eukprot:scaffold8266_cov97-Cylindrotheca_fusiformis.AAC.2
MGRTTGKNDKMRASAKERISLEAFVHRKGQVRALEEFKHRKQRKRVETAKALRSYRKVMKKEGFEAGKGASRKRVEGETSDSIVEPPATVEKEDSTTPKEYKKRYKTNPFQKATKKAEEHQKMVETKKAMKEKGEKERQARLKERKQRTKLLAKRTKRGQPIMKHMVDDLLHKLEKQNQR